MNKVSKGNDRKKIKTFTYILRSETWKTKRSGEIEREKERDRERQTNRQTETETEREADK